MSPRSPANGQSSYLQVDDLSSSGPEPTVSGSQGLGQQSTPQHRQQLFPEPVNLVSTTVVDGSERAMSIPMSRSVTSLSDSAVPTYKRRELSLPKKKRKEDLPALELLTTVQEGAIDSPTIPGRPPLSILGSDSFSHERSNSAPGGSWRQCHFGDAISSHVTRPGSQPREPIPRKPLPLVLDRPKPGSKLPSRSVKRLSPIFSPSFGSRPALRPYASASNLKSPDEIPPAVPPKSPSLRTRGSPGSTPVPKYSRNWPVTPQSQSSRTSSPVTEEDDLPPPYSGIARTPALSSSPHIRNLSEPSILHRGRPVRKLETRRRSVYRTESTRKELKQEHHAWRIPHGLPVRAAATNYQVAEKESLQNQARRQAEKFEVLSAKDVAGLSKELRAIDERCEYLRKTYKSLRSGRQKLHSRMMTYLKRTETSIFSRDSLMKQEGALAELDASIDDWNSKLEQAENRRLRVRQKLLEHVAAALLLDSGTAGICPTQPSLLTPPESPAKGNSPPPVDRKDIESIKIYADEEVLDLFASIEQAIGKMCISAQVGDGKNTVEVAA